MNSSLFKTSGISATLGEKQTASPISFFFEDMQKSILQHRLEGASCDKREAQVASVSSPPTPPRDYKYFDEEVQAKFNILKRTGPSVLDVELAQCELHEHSKVTHHRIATLRFRQGHS